MTAVRALSSRPHPEDAAGAFADGAVLFPLLLALAWQTGASAVMMLATTGVAYLATGALFRLPIPVQPLKSLSITAIATGASAFELQLAGALLGLIYFGISFASVDRLARRVPDALVHGFQLALGVLLVLTAIRLLGGDVPGLALAAAGGAAVILAGRATRLPLLGALALGGLLWGLWHAGAPRPADAAAPARAAVVAIMVLPQIALTLTNSILGTERAARAYFGDAAERVTPRRLLLSLGVGNLAVAALGGMPYCHGSGGVTAHYRGGSRTHWSNAVIGSTLLLLAALLLAGGGGLPGYPPALQALLLGVIGIFHVQLARPSWRRWDTRSLLLVMGFAALAFQDMLAVLTAGLAALAVLHLHRRLFMPHMKELP